MRRTLEVRMVGLAMVSGVGYLASDEATFVTGTNISFNGGQHMF